MSRHKIILQTDTCMCKFFPKTNWVIKTQISIWITVNKRRSGPFKETKITYFHKGLWQFNAVTQENKLLHVLSALNSTVLLKPKLYFMVFWRYLEFCESCQQSLFLSFSRFTLNIVSVKSHLLLCCGIDSSTHGTSRTEPRLYVLDQLISCFQFESTITDGNTKRLHLIYQLSSVPFSKPLLLVRVHLH